MSRPDVMTRIGNQGCELHTYHDVYEEPEQQVRVSDRVPERIHRGRRDTGSRSHVVREQ